MILRFLSSKPTWGSVLTAPILEPASDSISPSLCPSPAGTVCAISLKNKHWKKNFLSHAFLCVLYMGCVIPQCFPPISKILSKFQVKFYQWVFSRYNHITPYLGNLSICAFNLYCGEPGLARKLLNISTIDYEARAGTDSDFSIFYRFLRLFIYIQIKYSIVNRSKLHSISQPSPQISLWVIITVNIHWLLCTFQNVLDIFT